MTIEQRVELTRRADNLCAELELVRTGPPVFESIDDHSRCVRLHRIVFHASDRPVPIALAVRYHLILEEPLP